jgi:Fe-S-cluster-containing dehydrogenase component
VNRRRFLSITAMCLAGMAGAPLTGIASRTLLAKQTAADKGSAAKKWAMVVSLQACTRKEGCRDCVDACHRVHNVPDMGTAKEEIKWIWTAPYRDVFPEQTHLLTDREVKERPTLVLCNHCENPPCVRVCPTKATFQREDGIVMMDYHRCIGCRYCMAACPYGARSFNYRDPRPRIREVFQDYPTRTPGVVEKCNFCDERLVKGLLPACVEACKEKGLFFGDLNEQDSEVVRILRSRFVLRRRPHLGTDPKVYYLL